MTTVVESLQDATHELHEAAAFYQSRADQVAAQLNLFSTSATTTINNYINRAPILSMFIDENNGVDAAAGRGTDAAPYKTIDYALENTDSSVRRVVYLLSDCFVRKWRQLNQAVQFVGLSRVPSGSFGWPYSYTQRKLQFLGEATNSPRSDLGRVVPFFDVSTNGISFSFIDFVIPAPSNGVNYLGLINSNGGQCRFESVNLTVDSASSLVRLFAATAAQVVVTFYGTIGANVPGKIFDTVAAGANPNGVWNFRSNLTSA